MLHSPVRKGVRPRRLAVLVLGAALWSGGSTAQAATLAAGPREPFGRRIPLTGSPAAGGWTALTTAPARRVTDSVGINLDTWSHAGAYTFERWPALRAAIRQSGITAARVDVHLVSGDWGTQRQRELGQDGVRLNVELGDAFGRYSATPLDQILKVFTTQLLPYAEAVEGTNEPDLSGDPDWAAKALTHQRAIVDGLAAVLGTERLAVIAPPTGRPNNQKYLGNLTGLADYANAHSYAGGRYGSLGLDGFDPPAEQLLSGGPFVVTEAGWQTEPTSQLQQPGVPESVAARYLPKLILEAARRGIPRTYLFDLADRFDDPKLERIEAHFGLLHVDGTPKPAFGAVSRLMSELRDPRGSSAPSNGTAPFSIRSNGGALPDDLRTVAMRKSDGTVELALWRERSLWDIATGTPVAVPKATVRLGIAERFAVARVRTIAGNRTTWQFPFWKGLTLPIGDDVTVVRLMGRF